MTPDPLRPTLPGLLLVLAAFLAAVIAPLFTYSTTLALLGPAHVLSELRYVERRFSWMFLGRFGLVLGLLLGTVATVRALRVADVWGGRGGLVAELVVVLLLVLLAFFWQSGRSIRLIVGSLLGGALLGAGIAWDPAATILVLACLHNWTPVGFLWDASVGRRAVMIPVLSLFVLGPLLVASGLPRLGLEQVGLAAPELDWLTGGALRAQFGAYLPSAVRDAAWAQDAFSALVFAQCLHYATVLGVLPRLPGVPVAGAPQLFTRFGELHFRRLLVWGSVGLFVLFVLDFSLARGWYGVPAAIHAWIELPVLLVTILGARAVAR